MTTTNDSPRWFKSSYSNNGGACVEVAANVPGTIPVRDSKDTSGPALAFMPAAWADFVAAVRNGDIPGV